MGPPPAARRPPRGEPTRPREHRARVPSGTGRYLRSLLKNVNGGPIDRPPQRGGEELLDLLDGQGMDLKSLGHPILPQSDHGVGGLFTGPQRGEDERVLGGRKQVSKGGRGAIEELGVIDEDRHGLSPRPATAWAIWRRTSSRSVLGTRSGTRDAKAPKGRPAAPWVAATRSGTNPWAAATAR